MTEDTFERHGIAWSAEEERQLYDAFTTGKTVKECSAIHQRRPGGILSRLQILGLKDEEGNTVTPTPEFSPSAASQKREVKAEAAAQRKAARAVEKTKFSPELNERFRTALQKMEGTNDNLFITGKAGTGKSTLLSYFCQTTDKQPVVLAPTGVAALNVKGQTIHRFFNFYFDVTPEKVRRKNKIRNPKLFKKLKTIVIDEVSMVRADLLDCIDIFLRKHGPDPDCAFGGVQMIFIGDLYQLPPVVTSQEKEIFSSHYETPYFFSAHVLQQSHLELVELEKVYRQKDQDFVDLLNKIRNNEVNAVDIARINSRLSPSTLSASNDFHITLSTTNAVADAINEGHLRALKGKLYTSQAEIEGRVEKEYFPTAEELNFKIGAQVMMLNNDTDQRWVNGSIGVIEDVKEDEEGQEYLSIRLQDTKQKVEVYPYTWEVFKFGLEGGEITAAPTGTFTQYPFRLAWGITIHKSQGKTFERVVIDVGRGAFASGQIYVALSRCTSFEGVSLKTAIRAQDIRTDPRIYSFLEAYQPQSQEKRFATATDTLSVIKAAIEDKAALQIIYLKADDTKTESKVLPLKVGSATYQGQTYEGMKALCLQDEVERMYRVDRILKIARAGR